MSLTRMNVVRGCGMWCQGLSRVKRYGLRFIVTSRARDHYGIGWRIEGT